MSNIIKRRPCKPIQTRVLFHGLVKESEIFRCNKIITGKLKGLLFDRKQKRKTSVQGQSHFVSLQGWCEFTKSEQWEKKNADESSKLNVFYVQIVNCMLVTNRQARHL